jgi:hypothetical protein
MRSEAEFLPACDLRLTFFPVCGKNRSLAGDPGKNSVSPGRVIGACLAVESII